MKSKKISMHFKREEFLCACNRCDFDTADVELVTVLEDLRAHFTRIYGHCTVYISGPNRCKFQNDRTPGAVEGSYHMKAKAADIKVWMSTPVGKAQVYPDEVADYLEETYPETYGIGRYHGRTHIDVREEKARWDAREKKG